LCVSGGVEMLENRLKSIKINESKRKCMWVSARWGEMAQVRADIYKQLDEIVHNSSGQQITSFGQFA
jgi:hypothetical protein